MRVRSLIAVVASLAATPAAAESLQEELDRKKAELQVLTQQIHDAATSPAFTATQEVHATLRHSATQAWLTRISTPRLRITAEGVRAEGDLIYRPGFAKAWIEQPQDTKARIDLSPLRIASSTGQIDLSSHLTAHAETRVSLHILGVKTNVFCQSVPDLETDVVARLKLSAVRDGTASYDVAIMTPASLKATVRCYFGQLGYYDIKFPIDDLAKTVSEGKLDLGVAETIRLPLPTDPPSVIVLELTAQNQRLAIDSDGVQLGTDVTVGPPQLRAR